MKMTSASSQQEEEETRNEENLNTLNRSKLFKKIKPAKPSQIVGEIENLESISKLNIYEKLESKAPKLSVGQLFPFTRNSTTGTLVPVKENNFNNRRQPAMTDRIGSCDRLNSFGQENCSNQLEITTWITPD